ncbi:MAG TPA: DUF192 domain-containing protein [Thermoanaerobaculia bacterium]|nr:DUF192 domain-containing protein [Thermoanaerobaculia bacterium]
MRAAAMVMLMLFAACSQQQPSSAPSAPSETTSSQPAVAANGPRVIFPDGFVVNVEIAADDELRAQGLMYRDHLRPGTGMLFLFAEDEEHAFWMKNTVIPLDMVWIDANQRVVAVKYNVPPCKVENCPSYPPGVLSRYVLEVAGGVAQQHGIKAGDQLRFEQTEGIPIRP